MATPESGDVRIFVTSTDEKGAYRFDALPEGVYRVRLLKHGLEPVLKDGVELRFPFRAVVEVVMEPASGAAPPALSAVSSGSGPPGRPGSSNSPGYIRWPELRSSRCESLEASCTASSSLCFPLSSGRRSRPAVFRESGFHCDR